MDLSQFLPSLVEFVPGDGAQNVPLDQQFELKFSVALHPSVMNTSDFNRYIVVTDTQTDAPLNAQLVFPTGPVQSETVKFIVPGLQPGRTYQITILPDLPAFTGRRSGVRTVLSFSTVSAAAIVPTPELRDPGDNTQHTDPITLEWNHSGPGTYQYEVQIDRTQNFISPVWQTTTTGTQASVPLGTLDSREFYYWRVRAVDTSASPPTVSDWSPVWGFYYVHADDLPSEQLVLDTIAQQLSGDGFVIRSSLDEYEENLSNSWPVLEFVGDFNPNLQITFERRQVDGFPTWQRYQVPFTFTVTPSGDHQLLTIQTNEPFVANSVYQIVLMQDGKRYVKEFVSYYQPFYASVDAVLSLAQGLVEPVDMHDLNFLIYRRSLDANRHYIRWYPPTTWGIAGPQDATVRSMRIGHFYAVPRWVELTVACDLLRRRMIELASVAGQNRRLGDYSESTEGYSIQQIRQLLRDLQGQAEMWLAEFSKQRGVVAVGAFGMNALPNAPQRRIGEQFISGRDWRTAKD